MCRLLALFCPAERDPTQIQDRQADCKWTVVLPPHATGLQNHPDPDLSAQADSSTLPSSGPQVTPALRDTHPQDTPPQYTPTQDTPLSTRPSRHTHSRHAPCTSTGSHSTETHVDSLTLPLSSGANVPVVMQVKQEQQQEEVEEVEEVICIKEEPEEVQEVMATLLLDCQMQQQGYLQEAEVRRRRRRRRRRRTPPWF